MVTLKVYLEFKYKNTTILSVWMEKNVVDYVLDVTFSGSWNLNCQNSTVFADIFYFKMSALA